MKNSYPIKPAFISVTFIKFIFLMALALIINSHSFALVTITKASGGTNISADKSANATLPTYTALGNVVITEGLATDFSVGTNVTLTLTAPSGWTLNAGALVTASANPGNDIISANVTSITSASVTVQLTIGGNVNMDVLTISGLQVRANEGGNIPSAGNITKGGTSVISGCASGAILGSLSQAAGTMTKLVVTLPGQSFTDALSFALSGNSASPNAQTAGTSFTITKIRACDQFFNVITSYTGMKSLSYSGPSNGLTSPVYTTNVNFSGGASSTILTTNLKRAESTSITVFDGTVSGPASSSVTVNPGILSNFLVESSTGGSIGTQVISTSFNIRITARDANNNACSSGANNFSGTVNVTSTGTLSGGSGTTAAFSSGVLSSHVVTISNAGSFTISATKTAGSETGTSNSFAVNYPPTYLIGITPSCVTIGDPGFTITVDGNNFSGTSVVRFNGSDRSTTYINSSQLQATILAADISAPGVFLITVFTPAAGSTSPLTLNLNSSGSDNVSICMGTFHTLPDGIQQGTAGTYYSTIPNAAGCDSVITTNLSVTPSPSRTENISICPGDSYMLPDGTIESTPGTYYSLVPAPGCDSVITTNLSFHSGPTLTATPVQIDCFGGTGSVILNTSNGTAPFTYGPESTTNLPAGTYNFSVTDANGCSDNSSAIINAEPSPLILSATPTQISCFGGTGSVSLNATGGTPGYSYGGSPTTNLTAGNYNYQVMDNNGCIANANATINAAPAALTATTAITKTPCGASTGSATVTAAGGTIPYTYSWNTTPLRTTRTITGLGVGTYIVTVTDNNGCTISKSAIVTNLNAASFNVTGITGICPGGNTTVCAKAGFSSYSWSNGETTQCITVSVADTFDVVGTDSLGCQSIASVITRNSTFPNCTITGGTLCLNSSLTLRAPTGYASYTWSNGPHTSTNMVRSAGTYSVTVKNSDNCSSSCSYVVNSPLRTAVSKIDGKCNNEFLGSATVTATAGIPPYSYLWNNGATTTSVNGLAAGYYAIRVTDAGGCVSSFTTSIVANKTTYDYSTIGTNFNSNPISPGSYLWFSAVANVTHSGTYPITIRFTNQNITSTKFNLMPPNGRLIITNAVSQASTTFTNGEWVTTAPPNASGNYFVGGYSYPVIMPIAASLANVKWKGVWTASSSCVTNIQWKWSAATYSSLTVDNTLIDVNPSDDNSISPYGNNNPAGTPENFTGNCIAGGLSTGGSDFVGIYSSILNRLPCATQDVCPTTPRLANMNPLLENNFILNAYPNPFNDRTNIEFERIDKSCHLTIEIFTFFGQKVATIFNDDIEAGAIYRTEFAAGDLPDGIYTYRLIADDEVLGGKIVLKR